MIKRKTFDYEFQIHHCYLNKKFGWLYKDRSFKEKQCKRITL